MLASFLDFFASEGDIGEFTKEGVSGVGGDDGGG